MRVTVSAADAPGSANMAITLSSATRWTLRFAGGGKVHTVDLRGGKVAGVDFVAGVAAIDLTLPEPDGVVVVRMAGGATTFDVHAPTDVPVRVRMTGGGGSAVIDGATRSGIAGGTVIEPAGWADAADRYDIDAVAGVSSLSLDRRGMIGGDPAPRAAPPRSAPRCSSSRTSPSSASACPTACSASPGRR